MMICETKNELGEFYINHNDWSRVSNKSSVKSFFKHLNSQNEMRVVKISIARTGTVYINMSWGEFDAEYSMFGEGEEITIRFSDHANVAGRFSHDSRTENYTNPDYDIHEKNHNEWGEIFDLSHYYA